MDISKGFAGWAWLTQLVISGPVGSYFFVEANSAFHPSGTDK